MAMPLRFASRDPQTVLSTPVLISNKQVLTIVAGRKGIYDLMREGKHSAQRLILSEPTGLFAALAQDSSAFLNLEPGLGMASR
jgi:hypothetical protein